MPAPIPPIPPDLLAQAALGPDWAAWLARLPKLAAALVAEWELDVEGTAWFGFCSLVLPVHTAAGEPAALKISFDGDDESLHEGLVLQRYAGDPTVRLLRADPARRALLLERAQPRDLTGVWDLEACEIVAGFYPRLHVPALPQLATLNSYVERWLAELRDLGTDLPMPRRLVEQALHLGDALVGDRTVDDVVLHGDLHYANVLAADRAPWLVIDPKPMNGDPHYEPAPMLWDRWDEIADDVRAGVRRRFHTLVDGAGLDEDRARDWVVVRMVLNGGWSLQDAQRMHRALDEDERTWITRCVAIAKAVQE